jgi:hypothetical protein
MDYRAVDTCFPFRLLARLAGWQSGWRTLEQKKGESPNVIPLAVRLAVSGEEVQNPFHFFGRKAQAAECFS